MKKIRENLFGLKMRTVFMGTPQFAVPILESLLHSLHLVVAVYTQPDKPVGRGGRVAWSPVKTLAREHNIPVIQPETLKSAEVVEELANFKPQLIMVAAFGRILPQEMLSLPQFGCLNVHPSLLPRHRGPSPVANAILCGDEFTGVTLMLVKMRVDSGPILAQREMGISSMDTTGSLTSKLAGVGAELLTETLPKWVEGKLELQPQDETLATYSKLIGSDDGEIDWHLSAVELWHRVRAYNPWPSCYTWWKGKRLKIHEAIPLGEIAKGREGEVIALPELSKVGVITGHGILGLCQVQLEGKRQMPLDDFIRGQRDFIGSILG
jgi:methionyl-tRNA formyltransferase